MFPKGFVWGVATSSFQIEGGVHEDGRGPSIWDTLCRRPGAIQNGDTGDVATDHFHRWPEDLDLLVQLGVPAYRFSVAWPRVMPDGRRVEPRGLDFYRRLVDGMLERGIEPWLTLYHWDLPQALQDRGGWPARDTALAFADYAAVVGRALADRPVRWITHNEPWCAAILSHQHGDHAPGEKSLPRALAASHHLLLSHGLAVRALRAEVGAAPVGITLNFLPTVAASRSEADAAAARGLDGTFNRWFLEPVLGRGYPHDVVVAYAQAGGLTGPADAWAVGGETICRPGDLDLISQPIDFLGVNYYNRAIMRADVPDNLPVEVEAMPPDQWTDMPWEVHAPSLRDLLVRLGREAPGLPLYITENGAAYGDGPAADGLVHDDRRIRYHREHLRASLQAIREGADLRGYFAWSFLDNFEWAFGYSKRFGLVHVDFDTLVRTPKDSARWFAEVIRTDGDSLDG
jgi:beta-glucosidase